MLAERTVDSWRAAVRSQRAGIRGQESGIRSQGLTQQKAWTRSPKHEARSIKIEAGQLHPFFPLPSSSHTLILPHTLMPQPPHSLSDLLPTLRLPRQHVLGQEIRVEERLRNPLHTRALRALDEDHIAGLGLIESARP